MVFGKDNVLDKKDNTKRIQEIDMAKGLLILLMVAFHLGLFNAKYPHACQIVYAFHMSGFLLISGYLFSVNREPKKFLKSIYGIVVPYIAFEIVYLLGLGMFGKFIGASNTFDGGVLTLLSKIAFLPSGTYWYLHTMAICLTIYYIVNRYVMKGLSGILISSIILYTLSVGIPGFKWGDIIYFIIGILFRNANFEINEKLKSPISLLCFVLIIIFANDISRCSIPGIGLTLTFLGFIFDLKDRIPKCISNYISYIGRNSLAIVLFSPLFTVVAKVCAPFFAFDGTRIIGTICCLSMIVTLCLFCAILFDRSSLSRIIVGKNIYSKL
ncbi:Acyltransferase family protein [Xylanibacter ruminicola]|jgi:fucose 4-O-acetylase-like acetyltransferase|uniref:Acyltransferase family protein n=1 Tax=Xylanibacter ruminicola TaxID=839 RepID=A0A1H5THA5_XYLRU|nr:acyltransferase [Xylanibacter ruminicola]SEF62242.1 Acyltransferase family protein [Xylanibacter ruminicola]